ncbi:uncharacterized protein C8Q71DRAFT_701436 [Rhodofomes roseus]|uniref:Uncharacterized protein n=1 Tax=Rhodofomes roseus TaxID=34475 RepID=A0ABQ8KQR4_9APHY|nr:uncharacterized protein C8Q71DRAFT_701436 [Rhodofomes roseus]KAH9840967.1 hypothetical protein C8Q71DRAFT_701436 [Rhodofomes roseus]
MSSSWAPNETHYQMDMEKIWLQASIMETLPYGVELTLFAMCAITLLQNLDRSNLRRQLYLLTFITVIFGLGTICNFNTNVFPDEAFIEYRNFPGGPGAFLSAMFSDTVGLVNSVSWVVSNWLLDLFLIWRFLIIYGDFNRSWLRVLLLFPGIMVLTSIGMWIHKSNDSSNSTPFVVANLTLSFYVISLAANIIVTILIAGRLLVYRHHVKNVLGAHHANFYANVVAIFVESAVLYSVFALTFLITFGLNNQVSDFFLNYVNNIQAISSFLIIYRVATGKAWTEHTTDVQIMGSTRSNSIKLRPPTSIQFAHNTSADITDSMQISSKDLGIVISAKIEQDKRGDHNV